VRRRSWPRLRPQAQQVQILVELLRRFLRRSLGHVARGRDVVVRRRHPAVGALPACELPLGKDAGKGRVDGDAPRYAGLRLGEVQAPKRFGFSSYWLQRSPAASPCLNPAKPFRALEQAAILRDAAVRNQALDLLPRVDGRSSPRRILVHLLGQTPLATTHGLASISSSTTAVRKSRAVLWYTW